MNVDFFSAGNESCPQPQTSEHLAAIEIMKLKHILILQNKIDLITEAQAKEQHEQVGTSLKFDCLSQAVLALLEILCVKCPMCSLRCHGSQSTFSSIK